MKKRKFILFTAIVYLLQIAMPVWADKYEVLYVNSGKIMIGTQLAKKDLIFNDTDKITWTSKEQGIKALNLSTNEIVVLTQKEFVKRKAQSIKEIKLSSLSTRDYGISMVADTTCYLLDTLMIDAGKHYGDGMIDEVILHIDGGQVRTKIQKTKNKKAFILPRQIYGAKEPKPVYIDIIETDKQKDWTYYIYRNLYVEPLPMNADK